MGSFYPFAVHKVDSLKVPIKNVLTKLCHNFLDGLVFRICLAHASVYPEDRFGLTQGDVSVYPEGVIFNSPGSAKRHPGSGCAITRRTLKGFHKSVSSLAPSHLLVEPLQGSGGNACFPRVALASLADPGLLNITLSG